MTLSAPKPLAALIEDARVATLERYRDLPASCLTGLCRVSHAAAESLGATQAAVSFVGQSRVWFGGAFGFDRGETARESSFCDAVVRGGDAVVVADGSVDPRFLEHELVRAAPGLRSYAGVPLTEGGGYTLGTVAVFSAEPERFSAAMLGELWALAGLVRDFLGGQRVVAPAVQAVAAPVRRVQGWLGVRTVGHRERGGAEREAGLLVVSVARGSPAAEAGLRPTDILYRIGGQMVSAVPDISAALAGRVSGTRVPVRFRRGGEWCECAVEVRVKQRPFRVR